MEVEQTSPTGSEGARDGLSPRRRAIGEEAAPTPSAADFRGRGAGVARAVDVPVVGIGGITVARSGEVATTAAAGIAVVGAVMAAADVAAAVKGLLSPWVTRGA